MTEKKLLRVAKSLSSRRAWIEISLLLISSVFITCRSPHGERGLKFLNNAIFAVVYRRSPHGERGLKFCSVYGQQTEAMVALLTESVD